MHWESYLFELLTGALPYQISGSNAAEIMSADHFAGAAANQRDRR